jgi:hypothetical protein
MTVLGVKGWIIKGITIRQGRRLIIRTHYEGVLQRGPSITGAAARPGVCACHDQRQRLHVECF